MAAKEAKDKEKARKEEERKTKQKTASLQKAIDRTKLRYEDWHLIFPYLHDKSAEAGMGVLTQKLEADYKTHRDDFNVISSQPVEVSLESDIQKAEADSKEFGSRMRNFYKVINFNLSDIPVDKETARFLPKNGS